MKALNQQVTEILASENLGVSFSLLSCKDYSIDWRPALKSTIDLGFKRFRMMSYWNICEAKQGSYNFADLDEQLDIVKNSGAKVTLTIGMRQPRWPETHLPDWAKKLSHDKVLQEYLKFHRAVIERYKDNEVIESWQLENEFWLRSFGEHFDFSRKRLKTEFAIIREIDPNRPIIMSLAQITSLPLFGPKPDIFATSVYRNIYNSSQKKYTYTWAKPWVYKLKKILIKIIRQRGLIIHELQAEPWGPKANWEMSTDEQFKSMNPEQVKLAVKYSQATGISYSDLWGAEWWYWRSVKYNDETLNDTVRELIKAQSTTVNDRI